MVTTAGHDWEAERQNKIYTKFMRQELITEGTIWLGQPYMVIKNRFPHLGNVFFTYI